MLYYITTFNFVFFLDNKPIKTERSSPIIDGSGWYLYNINKYCY